MTIDAPTIESLIATRRAIEDDPASKNPPGGAYIYTAKARAKLAQIDRQITALLAEERKAAGRPVPVDGYSGRQSKRVFWSKPRRWK